MDSGDSYQTFSDDFSTRRHPARRVTDPERIITSDHQALRIPPLIYPGWDRAGLTYGPYPRQDGLAFGIHLLNGHHAAHTGHLTQGLLAKLKQWLIGSRAQPPRRRVIAWLRRGRKRAFVRMMWGWFITSRTYYNGSRAPQINDNLSVGWYPQPHCGDPALGGSLFVVRSATLQNGHLLARGGPEPEGQTRELTLVESLMNIPLYLVVILREQGAAYYAATLPPYPAVSSADSAPLNGIAPYPQLTPLAVMPFDQAGPVYPGVFNSVMGQIGFRVDTRLYSAHAAHLPAYARWYGTAHTADPLTGEGTPLESAPAETGQPWTVLSGGFTRTERGLAAAAPAASAFLPAGQPTGLLHVLVETLDGPLPTLALLFRGRDPANHLRLTLTPSGARLEHVQNGQPAVLAEAASPALRPHHTHSLHVAASGPGLRVHLDGQPLFEPEVLLPPESAGAPGLGLAVTAASEPAGGQNLFVRQFEAHPVTVTIPPELPFDPPWQTHPKPRVVLADDFRLDGPDSNPGPRDLQGRPTPTGGQPWQRTLGRGIIEIHPGEPGAAVRATSQQPNPDRTAYTLPWPDPTYADLALEQVPPHCDPTERGRGGLIFWQDERNYIIVNNWVNGPAQGAAVSFFYCRDGFEEVFDAIWVNVGSRIQGGQPYTLRVACDGRVFTAYVGYEPVLQRALTDIYRTAVPLKINRVGLVANWEWGNDTGTRFLNFTASA